MLPAAARLRRSRDFVEVVRRGRRAGRPLLAGHLLLDDGADAAPQVGFVVGRPVGNAVVRNRLRRRLRHLSRPLLADLPPGARLVVRARPSAAAADVNALRHDLDRLVARLCPRPPERSS